MGKDPAFLFYPNDWIGGTMGMTLEEKGAYMELLMMQFNRGHMTSHMIGLIIGQLWVKVEDKFEVDDKGLYFNRRLDEEKEKRKRFTESRRNNKSGKNQYSKPIEETGHMTSHMENENENENIDETEVEIWPTFEDFWTGYNKKVGSKDKCKKKFDKLKQETKENIMNHIFDYVKSTPDKQYRKNPESYLNGKSWNDEIILNKNGTEQKQGFTKNLADHFRKTDPNWKNL